MSTLADLLAEYDARLQAVAPDVAGALAKGLPGDAIAARLDAAAIPAHPDLVDWFSWHNGYRDPEHARPVFGGVWLRSLERALELTELLRGTVAYVGREPLASRTALRLNDDISGGALWFETTGAGGTGAGLYVLKYRGESTVRVGDDLASLVRAWLGLLDFGIQWVDGMWTPPSGIPLPRDLMRAAGYPLPPY